MKKRIHDPLLTAARVILTLLMGLMIFAMVMVTIGLGAVLTVQRGEVTAKLVEAGAPATLYGWLVAALALVVGLLFLGVRFALELGRIVDSVGQGDPFRPENADRLARMGWLTLGIQAGALMLLPIAIMMQPYSDRLHVEGKLSLGGLLLALVLFILARVFRHGTTLRTELEGTV